MAEANQAGNGILLMGFGLALEALKKGKKIWRENWNNNTIRIQLFKVPIGEDGKLVLVIPGQFAPDDKIMGTWHPSPIDLMAEDWRIE
jgi:hypothetical protein